MYDGMSAEAYVRKHWGEFSVRELNAVPAFWAWLGPNCVRGYPFNTTDEAWKAAADYTQQRLEEIRKVDEEIAVISGTLEALAGTNTGQIYLRILGRETKVLEELKRGLKQ